MNTKTKNENFERVRKFYDHEKVFLEHLQMRWEDECNYEEPQDYKNAIIERADLYNLEVKKIILSYRDLSIRIEFKFEDSIGHVDILKTQNKIYIKKMCWNDTKSLPMTLIKVHSERLMLMHIKNERT